MNEAFLHFAAGPIAVKIMVSIGIGMLIGMEREWSNKEVGIRTFSVTALLGMLASMIGTAFIIGCLAGVFLLIIFTNGRSLWADKSIEITTSAVLIVNYTLGVLVGLGHIFTPVAGAIIIMMLLAWKTELTRFTDGLQPSEIRSAILLGLIGFVIFPLMPNRYVDPWQLFNPHDAWSSIIAISGISFVNYICLRVFRSDGLYLSAIFGGIVNSTATVAEISSRAQDSGLTRKVSTLCLLTTVAMFVRNLVIVLIFSPLSLGASLIPLLAMSLIAGFWIWRDHLHDTGTPHTKILLNVASPISLKKVLWFGLMFLVIQIGGTLLTKIFGSYGILATGIFGGLASSASTTAAAATMARHGKITASMAGSVAIVSSLASTVVNLPIIWRIIKDKAVIKRLTMEIVTVMMVGIALVITDRVLQVSEILLRNR